MTTKRTDSGFTLVETLIAIVILIVGLVAVTNLLLFSGRSNFVAHATTGAVSQGTEVMERLKAIPFTALQAGGNLTVDAGAIAGCNDDTQAGGCVIATNFNAQRNIPGPGIIKTRWQITAINNYSLFISVRAESTAAIAGSQARAEFTTFRSCTSSTPLCPL